MEIPDSQEMIKLVENDGWVVIRIRGSHHHFAHPVKPGIVTIPHPLKDLKPGTVNSIKKQAGLK